MATAYSAMFKINLTGLRFFTVYGPRGRPDMAPFKFVDRIARGQMIDQFGDGSSSRDYTYIDDIVFGVLAALMRPYRPNGNQTPHTVYNLGKLLRWPCFIHLYH
jgi:UDP-glucuronate 4-epimerase